MKRLFFFLAGICLLPALSIGQSGKMPPSISKTADAPGIDQLCRKQPGSKAAGKAAHLRIQKVSRPAKSIDSTATVTLEVLYDCGEGNGYQLLLDADATAYGTQIPEYGDLTNSTDAEDGVYDVFEYKIPGDANGIIAEEKWLSFNESASIEIAPGTYDFVITHPDENYGIQVAYGDTREDDFVFEAGIEYIFTIFPDSWGEICILTRQASTDLALIDLLSPQSCDTLSGNESISVRICNAGRDTVSSFTVGYMLDGQTVEEKSALKLAPKDSMTYTFLQKADFSETGKHLVTAFVKAEDDPFQANDSISTPVYKFGPSAGHFACDFSNQEDMQLWTVIDANQDGRTWQYETGIDAQGERTGYVSALYNATSNADDYLVCRYPVALPEGNNHIVFYYKSGSDHLPENVEILISSSAGMENADTIGLVKDFITDEWEFARFEFRTANAGNYYIAFHASSDTNMNRVQIDDVEISAGDFTGTTDLIAGEVLLPKSACGLSQETPIGIRLHNGGNVPIPGYKLAYTINGGKPVEERFLDSLPVGKSRDVYFTQPADLSDTGAYEVSVTAFADAANGALPDAYPENDMSKGHVTHFSPQEPPYFADLTEAGQRAEWVHEEGCWTYDSVLHGMRDLAISPLYSRCIHLKGNTMYRLSLKIRAGMNILGIQAYENFAILIGVPGSPFEEYQLIQEFTNCYTQEKFQTFDVDFAIPEEGAFNLAILPESLTCLLYVQSVSIIEVPECDIRINEATSSLARLTPSGHTEKPAFLVQAENRGALKQQCHINIWNGSTLMAQSKPFLLDAGEIRSVFFQNIVPPAATDTGSFRIEACLQGQDAYPGDNARTYSFSISDTMYVHDSCRSYADGIGTQAFGFANLFSLSQTDTLTGIEIGMMDMTGIAEQDFEMEVRIYAADTSTGMPGRLLLEETITRPLRGGLVAYDIPDRLLPAGHYLIALYQTGTDNIAIAYDDTPSGSFIVVLDNQTEIIGEYGNIALRAILGHHGHVLGKDVETVSIDSPAENGILAANESVTATIRNNGYLNLENVPVSLNTGKKDITTTIDLLPYESKMVEFEADLSRPGTYLLTVASGLPEDEVPENDSAQREIQSEVPSDPYIMDWEHCQDFSVERFNPAWITLDRDGSPTYAPNNATFPHMNEPFAFMAFNPSQATPSLEASNLYPHSGKKLGVSICPIGGGPNDDWLISPKLTMPAENAKISFWVKILAADYNPELFNVLVSETDMDPCNFQMAGSTREATSVEWEQVEIDLSAYAGKDIHIAIQCVSENKFIFMIDDIHVSKPSSRNGDPLPSQIHLYPNPAKNQIHFYSSDANILSLRILDLNGRIIHQTQHLNSTRFNYNVSCLHPGLYFAEIRTAQGTCHMKFIIQ